MEFSSPSSLLSKLDELKKWQETQQNRLIQLQPGARLDVGDNYSFRNRSGNKDKCIQKTLSSNDARSPDTVQPLEISNCMPPPGSNANITKKTYLKRGSGLSKYGLSYGEHRKPSNKMKAHKPTSNKTSHKKKLEKHEQKKPIHVQDKKEQKPLPDSPDINKEKSEIRNKPITICEDQFIDQFSLNSNNLTPLKAPETKIISKAKWYPVPQEEDLQKDDQSEIPADESSKIEETDGMQTPANEMHEKEPAQTDINNPMLLKCLQKLADAHFDPQNETSEDLLSKLTLGYNSTCQTPSSTDYNVDLIKYLQNLVQKCEATPMGDLTKYEEALEKELHVFERVEQKVMSNSFNSANSSIFELLASTPKREVKKSPPNEVASDPNIDRMSESAQTHCEEEQTTIQAKKMLVYPEVCDKSSEKDDSSVTSDDFQDTLHECEPESNDFRRSGEIIIRQNASTNTDPIEAPNNLILHTKLAELEKEIATFRSETQKLNQLQNEVENERIEFHKAKRDWEQEFQEAREHYESKIEEERKKLMKEKTHFERYTKELLAKPSRKEREQIANLKQELANVQEKLKVKETRSGTSQARMRNQIKSLEKDNQQLKDELDGLQKQYAKLQAQQVSNTKKGNVETKMLHEINKNLTKLANDSKLSKHINKIETTIAERDQCEESLRLITTRTSNNYKNNTSVNKTRKKSTNSQMSMNEESDDSLKHSRRSSRARKKSVHKSSSEQSSSEDEFVEKCMLTSKNRHKTSHHEDNYHPESHRSVSRSKSSFSPHKNEYRSRKNKTARPLEANETKENDCNSLNSCNSDITTFRNLSDLSINKHYEKMFGNKKPSCTGSESQKLRRNESNDETQLNNGEKIQTILPDGSMEAKYPNGNIKIISNDGNLIKMNFFNGDIKETSALTGTVRYFFKKTQIWQTTTANGDEILEFPDGQIEKLFADGSAIINFPDGVIRQVQTDGIENISYPDGSVVKLKPNGEKTLILPNGEKEFHTEAYKRREYPDGTVKILYPDGLQETRYSNGRIRMKDNDGNLIMDSHEDC